MKILTIAIPNHHFFQWVNQLEGSGHEVYWFDITDAGGKSDKISWVQQIKGWKRKLNYPGRQFLKKNVPMLERAIARVNAIPESEAFRKALQEIQPDILHCFEMKLAGFPILEELEQSAVPLIYSSWGSDLFYMEALKMPSDSVRRFLKRADYLITDCHRDQKIAQENGFTGAFLGVYPGNGGISTDHGNIKPADQRNVIMIKGYDDGVGQAGLVLRVIEQLSQHLLKGKRIVIYSADAVIKKMVEASQKLSALEIEILERAHFIQNTEILKLMGKSCIHIASSLSDGLPNALLEAMAMGAFPIQSNPGGATEEVITHGENGLLIRNPLDTTEISEHLQEALTNETLRSRAQEFNTKFIASNYNRATLRPKIVALYEQIEASQ